MNFKNIKNLMDAENMDQHLIPNNLKTLNPSDMPIQKIRKSMRSEIITQLFFIVVFFLIPSFIEMHELPRAVYYILMFVTCLITLGYLAKMNWFLKKTQGLSEKSREVIITYINDLNLTLEVYKTAIISGSLLLPISMLALLSGATINDKDYFSDIFLLKATAPTLLLYVIGYLAVAVVIYFVTIWWAEKLYGVHIKRLKATLEQLEA